MKYPHEFVGELIGTFLLVLFGCGSVAVTILFSAHVGLLQVAAVWGLGVSVAIYATRHLSCAHLNPAVSFAMVLGRRMSLARLPVYLLAQFSGASARDFAPRLFAYIAGWGRAAFPDRGFGFFTVYVLGPLVGAGVAAWLFTRVVEPLMKGKGDRSDACDCQN